MPRIILDPPNIQISFANALDKIRSAYLQDALSSTVASMEIRKIDSELHDYVDNDSLQLLAQNGMRGELLFSIPSILKKSPQLLGYYRLLLGYSQKGFYTSETGAGMFKSLEEKGKLSQKQSDALPDLCNALNQSAKYMLDRLDARFLNVAFFDQLTLLTLGPQLRGGANVRKGSSAMSQLFDIIFQIVNSAVISSDARCIKLKNNSGRTVYIQFASDPDIVIREELTTDVYKNLVAIEVKGGEDYSNIHNRVGEAEKSHQKAKKNNYVECWTVVNVDRIDMVMAHRESPATNRFYRLSELLNRSTTEYRDFSLQILSIVGI